MERVAKNSIIKTVALIFALLFFATSLLIKTDKAKAQTSGIEITLRFGNYALNYEDKILLEPDFTITSEFHERRINAPYEEKVECVTKSLAEGASPKSAMLYTFPLFDDTVRRFLSKVNATAQDATITFRPYNKPMFTIKREQVGYKVNEEKLYFDVYSSLRKSRKVVVEVQADELQPNITAEQLKKYTHLRSSFSTDYGHSNENRKHNIRLALSRINGTAVDDGGEFSFNKTVGKRTESNGFAEAKIILDGEYVDGTGGGVCQASTTVYNCALLADMKITSARAHSLPPSYIQPSFDAMVNSGTSDLKFTNESGGPIFIRAYGTDEKAVVEIYGEKLPYKIKRESKVISKTAVPKDKTIVDIDDKYDTAMLEDGQTKRVSYGVAGLSSEGYLSYYDGSVLIDRKLIRKDTYRPVQGIIAQKPYMSEIERSKN